jgi:PhnB protein
VDASAKAVMPIEDMFYGDGTGQVQDPFGYKWMIATHKEDESYPKMQKRSDKVFAAQKSM